MTELYQYAIDHQLTARPGFKPKSVKCYVLLTSDGRFVDIEPVEKDRPPTMAPDIGGLAQGASCCNLLIEKALYPLRIMTENVKKNKNIAAKHEFYLNAVREGGKYDSKLNAIAVALSDDTTRAQIAARLCENYKPDDSIGFIVDGLPAEASTDWLDWWDTFRKTLSDGRKDDVVGPVCLITGQNAPALKTVSTVGGLKEVGGDPTGVHFLCFDKKAFTSYGLEQSTNAPVSELAMSGINAALDKLLPNAEVFGGAKLVYWYSQDVMPEQDPLRQLVARDENDDSSFFDDDEPEPEEDTPIDAIARAYEAEAEAKSLIQSAENGKRPLQLPNAHYYILPVSGVKSRMMVRGWYEGRFEELYRHINLWFEDLRLTLPRGRGDVKPSKLRTLCKTLLSPGEYRDPQKIIEEMMKELGGLSDRIFYAAVKGTPLPDEVASKALYNLRSCLLSSDGNDDKSQEKGKSRKRGKPQKNDKPQKKGKQPVAIYQLLKCWLVRRQRQRGEVLMEKQLRLDYPSVAYQCGRLMAVYAAIQQAAMGRELGTGVVERYYGAAIISPLFVLGSLSRLSNYHLSKIENPNHAMRYRRMLNEISTQIAPGSIPRIMTMEQQSEFALGYYQQNAALYTKAPETKE